MTSSFLPVKQGFPIFPGATFRYEFQFKDNDGTSEKPRDLTGYTGECNLVGNDGSELLLTTANGGIKFGDRVLKDPTNGFIEIFIADKKEGGGPLGTEEVTWTTANYVLFIREPGGEFKDRLPIMAGLFRVVKKV